jgi:glutamate dehydrogenase (NADP+)
MSYAHELINRAVTMNPAEFEFHQAVEEVMLSLQPLFQRAPKYQKHRIGERVLEPERQIIFAVPWIDDKGDMRINRGFRIQFNSALGPYKGGFRFHPSVTQGTLKFLGFEQIFKNSLTGLAIGGAKGGCNFDPKGKSDNEIMRFCQSFMTELFRYLGPNTDVPAGDIGVSAREIGYMFGQYKRLTARFEGVLTGKNAKWGGSLGRTEATGYGLIYMAENMLKVRKKELEGMICTVSGAGNVATYTVEKLYHYGAKPVTVSDSQGMIHHPGGINLEVLKQVKEVERARLTRYAELCKDAVYIPVERYPQGRNAVWSVPCLAAFPCATQNELNEDDAKQLLANGCILVGEGANMPSTVKAVDAFLAAGIVYAPGKAANAGGVATSQLEMAQNASMQQWGFEKVDRKIKQIMLQIFTNMHNTAEEFGQPGNYVLGANIAGFRKVADAMLEQGTV